MNKVPKNELIIMLTAVLLGLLISSQTKSFSNVNDVINRNTRSDIFREIQILKKTNENLLEETFELSEQLDKISDNQEAINSVKVEIEKYRMIVGEVAVHGPGINLKLSGDVKSIWLIDIVNELFTAGAEAVSVNSIRLTNQTIGFDTIPNGQILLNGIILNKPYSISAIGNKSVLKEALKQSEGIIERMNRNIPDVIIEITEEDRIEIDKII